MNLKLSYSVKNFKGLPIIRMNNPNDIGLMQAICKESGGKMIFKTRQNVNLPAQLINTIKPVAFVHQNRLSIIGANSYIAAYRTQKDITGAYLIARIDEKTAEQLINRYAKIFSPDRMHLNIEKALYALPTMSVLPASIEIILARHNAREIFNNKKGATAVRRVINFEKDCYLQVLQNTKKPSVGLMKIHAGQSFAVVQEQDKAHLRLCALLPEDVHDLIRDTRYLERYIKKQTSLVQIAQNTLSTLITMGKKVKER